MPYDVSNKNGRHCQSVLYALLVAVGINFSSKTRTIESWEIAEMT